MKDLDNILKLTENSYSRVRYGEKAWKKAILLLANENYQKEEIQWIMNSKYARWSADSFAKFIEKNNESIEKLNGSELIQYKNKWGIEIEKDDLPEILEKFNNLPIKKIASLKIK